MATAPTGLLAYYASGKPLSCKLDVDPYLCEIWQLENLTKYNADYEVQIYAPEFFGFGSNGGGEMLAVSPTGEVVCLPFIGMEPAVATPIASSWDAFEGMLRNAL